ncbi:MAG: DUF2628 domain-containing protein [Devosia sp.]
MTLYSIFEKQDLQQASALGPAAVPERFSWFAFVLPPLYALRHGLILMLLFWVVLAAGLSFAAPTIGIAAAWGIYWLVAAFLGFEASALRRDALVARGWVWRGDMVASDADIAERDYLSLRR